MIAVLLGLGSAVAYGVADFGGGVAAARTGALRATAGAAAVGSVPLAAATWATGVTWSWPAVGVGVLAGLCGAAALGLLYASLAQGAMGVVSPLTAVLAGAVPLGWAMLAGDAGAGPLRLGALALALVAVLLVASSPGGRRPPHAVVAMAVAAGLLIGLFPVLMDLAPSESGLAPLVVMRLITAAVMVALVVALGRGRRPSHGGGLGAVVVCGLADAVANALLVVGIQRGDLAVVSVLAALYPATTVLLAARLLGERVPRLQWAGLGLAVTASGALALT